MGLGLLITPEVSLSVYRKDAHGCEEDVPTSEERYGSVIVVLPACNASLLTSTHWREFSATVEKKSSGVRVGRASRYNDLV
jgi:hypothetical protein